MLPHKSWKDQFIDSSFLHLILIALLCLLAYSNTFHVPFAWDDEYDVRDNAIVHDIGNFLFSSAGNNYNPRRFIGYLTFALNYRLGGPNVTGYHVFNLAIHIATSLLVYGLVALTFRTPSLSHKHSEISTQHSALSPQSSSLRDSNLIALFSALVFAVHPIQTQAVTYIVQRYTSLAAMFYVASLYCYVRFRLAQESNKNIRWQEYVFYGLSVASAVLAMKTKEIAFTLPFIVVLYEAVFFGSSKLIKRALWALPLLATVVIIPLTMLNVSQPLGKVLSEVSQRTVVQTDMPRWEYLMTQFTVIVTYIRLLFFPVGQNLDYDYPTYKSFFYPQVMLSFLFLAALFGLGIYLVLRTENKSRTEDKGLSSRREDQTSVLGAQSLSLGAQSSVLDSQSLSLDTQSSVLASQSSPFSPAFRLMGFGILWFFITISVESSIIPIADVIFEHRVYLPSIGMIICVVTGAFLLKEQVEIKVSAFSRQHPALGPLHSVLVSNAGRTIIVMLALAVGVLTVATYMRNEVWTSDIRLWKDIAAKSPAKARAHYNLGYRYRNHHIFDKSVEQNLLAVKLSPEWAEAHDNLGESYQAFNMPDKAIEQYLIAIKLSPDYPQPHYNLGVVYDQSLNMPDKAIKEYLIAIKLNSVYLEAHNNLGDIYQSLNMPDKAIEQYMIDVKLKPDYPEAHYNLGNVYKSLNMTDKALEQYMLAVKFRPEYIEAHNNLAILYQALNMPDKAVTELQTVLRIDPNVSTAHFNLGVLYYNMGQMENARRELIARLKLKPDDQIASQLLNAISH